MYILDKYLIVFEYLEREFKLNKGELLMSNSIIIFTDSFICPPTKLVKVEYQNKSYFTYYNKLLEATSYKAVLGNYKHNKGFSDSFIRNKVLEYNALKKTKDSFDNVLALLNDSIDRSIIKMLPSKFPLFVYDYNKLLDSDMFYGIQIELVNFSPKTIKYITFGVSAYNPVDDIVKIWPTIETIKYVKGVGPIYENRKATYSFENIWYSHIISYVKIRSIKIEYTDGTFKTINPFKYYDISEDQFDKVKSHYSIY